MAISPGAKKVLESDISSEIVAIEGVKQAIADLNTQLEAREIKLTLMLEAVGASRDDFQRGSLTDDPRAAKRDYSFRDLVRGILRDSGDYMTVREIANGLKRIGYEYSGTTEITTRLGNDLSRMLAQGGVVKSTRRDGNRKLVVYKLKEAD